MVSLLKQQRSNSRDLNLEDLKSSIPSRQQLYHISHIFLDYLIINLDIKCIRACYGEKLVVILLGAKDYMEEIEHDIAVGETCLLENSEAILNPLIGRSTIRKGCAIKLVDKEIEYHPEFRLILQTKLANSHYKSEMQTQIILINFIVTCDGLVAIESPYLENLNMN